MTKTSLAAVMVLAMFGTASAGGQAGTIGVGAEYGLALGPASAATTSGLGFASLNFDAGTFHAGGFLAFADGGNDDDTIYGVGGRFFFHVHSGSMSDFSVGGNLGLLSIPEGMGSNDNLSLVFLEPGIQIRLFPASNVALSFTTGIAIGLVDADGFVVGGQVSGAAGIHYYFF